MTRDPADELAILKLVARLAQAADDRDEEAYRACLASEVQGGPPGTHEAAIPANCYAKASIARVSQFAWTHHKLMNPIVEVDEDHATARIDVVVDRCGQDDAGRVHRATIGGRYDLGFIRSNGEWRIDRRRLSRRYAICNVDAKST